VAADPITFGIVSANPNYWAVFVGQDKGFYERHGIKLDVVLTGTSATDAAFIAQQKVPGALRGLHPGRQGRPALTPSPVRRR
jgi:ABC-type nitrate/sulfonate/bicarbonate transport system substrate-binding protein